MALYFSQAVTQLLEASGAPVVTEHSLAQLIAPILDTGRLGDEKVHRVPMFWTQSQSRAMVRTLVKRRVLVPDQDFRAGVWRVVRSPTAPSAEDAICLVDPFAYISHLSAMQRYGLTDRAPEALHMTTPARALWTKLRDAEMQKERREADPFEEPPPLIRIGFHERVRRRPVILHETKHPATPVAIADSQARIAEIGRVFVDMLDQPALCGGIQHVLSCFERHAEAWLDEIVAGVDANDSPIVKVRAGYILDEELELDVPALARWIRCAQRGGSRKLDPHAPYGNRFSEKWMIALNV